jgi:hypothetical protein
MKMIFETDVDERQVEAIIVELLREKPYPGAIYVMNEFITIFILKRPSSSLLKGCLYLSRQSVQFSLPSQNFRQKH